MQKVIEKLNKKGLIYKPFKREIPDEYAGVDESDEWERSKYKPKEFPEVDSTPLHVRMEEKIEASFTGVKGTEVPIDDTGAPATTPGKGDENVPFIIMDNGNSPTASSSSLATKEFPSISRTPQNGNTVSGESSAGLYPAASQVSLDSLNTRCKKAIDSGIKEHDGKRKRQPSNFLQSPYEQNARRKRVKKSKLYVTLFVNVFVS